MKLQGKYSSCISALEQALEKMFNNADIVTGVGKDYDEFVKSNTFKKDVDVFALSYENADVTMTAEDGTMMSIDENISMYHRITTSYYPDVINRINDVAMQIDGITYVDEYLNDRTITIEAIVPVVNTKIVTIFLINILVV